MGLLKNLISGLGKDKSEFKAKLKQAQEEDKIMNVIEERKKSANQRELERWHKEQQEKYIKEELDKIHKQNNKELWRSKNSILAQKTNILKDDRPILKEKNIFMDNRNDIPFVKKGGMFFK